MPPASAPIPALPIANRVPVDRRRIRWIAFDAVGTLIHPTPPAAAAYHHFACRHGSRLPAGEIARRFRLAFRATERGDLDAHPHSRESGLITSEVIERRRWKTIVTTVIDDIPNTDACFFDLFTHFSRPASWGCFTDVGETLSTLRAGGVQLAMASNFDGRLHAVCEGMPELRAVDRRVVSSEVGFRKPSPKFFDALLSRLDCQPGEVLMVGDDRESDSDGAALAGISAVLVNRRQTPADDEIGTLLELPRWLGL